MEIVKTIALKKSKLILIVSKNNQTTKNPPQCYQHRSGSANLYRSGDRHNSSLNKKIIPQSSSTCTGVFLYSFLRKEEVKENQIDEQKTKYLYAARLFNKGWSRNKVSEELQTKYGVGQTTAAKYIREAYKIIADKNDNLIKNLRHIQLTRLETLLDIAISKNDVRSATEVIKTINSMFGLNQPEIQVNIQNNECQFKFGDPIINDKDI